MTNVKTFYIFSFNNIDKVFFTLSKDSFYIFNK